MSAAGRATRRGGTMRGRGGDAAERERREDRR